jgi:hypothetical protein
MKKYETPELTALTPAINAIQGTHPKRTDVFGDPPTIKNESSGAYQDWE